MKIGIIGAGRLGRALAKGWRAAGHGVVLGARRPGPDTVTLEAAAEDGEVVVLAVPAAALADVSARVGDAVAGTLIVDATRPTGAEPSERERERERERGRGRGRGRERGRGSGVATAAIFPRATVVKALSALPADVVAGGARGLAMPVAGPAVATETVSALIRDLGLEPVVVGPLEAAQLFDPGALGFEQAVSAAELRRRLFRRDEPDGEVVIYRSPVIPEPFVHGFPERTGGLSKGLRSSLNVGYRWGDDRTVVEDNRRLVAEAAGYSADALVVTRHVHGNAVWIVDEEEPDGDGYDGLVSASPGPVLAAFAADCVPLVFADPDSGVFGAAHAGWRGSATGAAANVVRAMVRRGARADRIRVALGPCIGACCFEVGPEVVAAFEEFLGSRAEVAGLVVPGPAKDHIDLRVANRVQLEREGVLPDHIDSSPPCTRCHSDRFFSYRRDGFMGGVHMGFIGVRG